MLVTQDDLGLPAQDDLGLAPSVASSAAGCRVRDGRRRDSFLEAARFFARFLRRPKSMGAVLPSSYALATALAQGTERLQPGDVVVELGPGTGAITRRVAELLPAGVDYLGIELEPGLVQLLRRRYPGLRFHCGSAADMVAILDAHRLPAPRLVISSLPFASLPAKVRRRVIRNLAHALHGDGEFRTFQYLLAGRLPKAARFHAAMAEQFVSFERFPAVLRNVPPAAVLNYARPARAPSPSEAAG